MFIDIIYTLLQVYCTLLIEFSISFLGKDYHDTIEYSDYYHQPLSWQWREQYCAALACLIICFKHGTCVSEPTSKSLLVSTCVIWISLQTVNLILFSIYYLPDSEYQLQNVPSCVCLSLQLLHLCFMEYLWNTGMNWALLITCLVSSVLWLSLLRWNHCYRQIK